MKKNWSFFYIVYFILNILIGQTKYNKSYYLIDINESALSTYDKGLIDSLISVFHTSKNDTVKLNCIKGLAATLSDDKLWVPYNNYLIKLTKGKTDSLSIAFYSDALNNVGYYQQYIKNNLDSAIHYYYLSFEIADKIKYYNAMGIAYNNLAFVFQHQGLLEKSIELYNEAYKIFLKRQYPPGITSALVNMGNIYLLNDDYAKAEENFNLALIYANKVPGGFKLGNIFNQLAVINQYKKNYSKSFYYLFKAENIHLQQSDYSSLALTYINIATNHQHVNDLDKSNIYFQKANSILKNVTELSVKSKVFNELSNYYKSKKETEKALLFADSAYLYAKKIGYPQLILNASMNLSEIYKYKNKFELAYSFLKESHALNDSINNDKIKKSILKQQYKAEYEKKEILMKASQDKKDAENRAEKKRQKVVLVGALLLLLASIVVIYFVYKNYAAKKKTALVLEEKNEIITKQKLLVEEKQKEILDSIHYAQKIQSAVLTGENVWKKISPDYFILYQPKDIVSGDFYWAFNTVNSRSVFALADCTGHGVPGGFMSMLGNSFLNEIVVENKIFNPAEILNKLRSKIISSLGQEGSADRRDGMDMAVCNWNKLENKLEFAGANNRLWIVRNGVLLEIMGDKMPVGNYTDEPKPFTCHSTQLEKNDLIVLCTDGFADQFGGDGGKKLMSKNLKNFIVNNADLPIEKQKEELYNLFRNWKGKNEQVDDVSLIALKV